MRDDVRFRHRGILVNAPSPTPPRGEGRTLFGKFSAAGGVWADRRGEDPDEADGDEGASAPRGYGRGDHGGHRGRGLQPGRSLPGKHPDVPSPGLFDGVQDKALRLPSWMLPGMEAKGVGFAGPPGPYQVTIEVPSLAATFSHTWKFLGPDSPPGAVYHNAPACTQIV